MEKLTNDTELLKHLISFKGFLPNINGDNFKEPSFLSSNKYSYVDNLFIETLDGSFTLKHKLDDDTEKMHNDNGAIIESVEKFLKPSEFDFSQDIKMLDICSGLGYNTAVVLDAFINFKSSNNVDSKIQIDLIEISKETLSAALLVPEPLHTHRIVKNLIKNQLIKEKYLEPDFLIDFDDIPKVSSDLNHISFDDIDSQISKDVILNQFIDDARKTVKKLEKNSYDFIFLDPFSPIKTPELVSVEFIRELSELIKKDGLLVTYTSSAAVRSALFDNGFYIGEGPIFGRSNGGTLASLLNDNIKTRIPSQDERNIAFSDVGIPFRDEMLNLTSKEIKENRSIERKESRGVTKLSSAVQTPKYIGEDIDDEKLKRRVLRNTSKVGIYDLKSDEAYFLIEPQNNKKIKNSYDTISKMKENFQVILSNKK